MDRAKLRHDRKIKPSSYDINDLVLRAVNVIKSGRTKKLAFKYDDIYIIRQLINEQNYIIKKLDSQLFRDSHIIRPAKNAKSIRIHHNQLKAYIYDKTVEVTFDMPATQPHLPNDSSQLSQPPVPCPQIQLGKSKRKYTKNMLLNRWSRRSKTPTTADTVTSAASALEPTVTVTTVSPQLDPQANGATTASAQDAPLAAPTTVRDLNGKRKRGRPKGCRASEANKQVEQTHITTTSPQNNIFGGESDSTGLRRSTRLKEKKS